MSGRFACLTNFYGLLSALINKNIIFNNRPFYRPCCAVFPNFRTDMNGQTHIRCKLIAANKCAVILYDNALLDLLKTIIDNLIALSTV